MSTAPRDGTLLDVLFDVPSADPRSAEAYAPGCTRKEGPTSPFIENVAFGNDNFTPVLDAQGALAMIKMKGGWGGVSGVDHAVANVTLTHWRPAAYPHV